MMERCSLTACVDALMQMIDADQQSACSKARVEWRRGTPPSRSSSSARLSVQLFTPSMHIHVKVAGWTVCRVDSTAAHCNANASTHADKHPDIADVDHHSSKFMLQQRPSLSNAPSWAVCRSMAALFNSIFSLTPILVIIVTNVQLRRPTASIMVRAMQKILGPQRQSQTHHSN